MKFQKMTLLAGLLLFAGSITLQAQAPKDSLWTTTGFVGLKLTQGSFSNWATGGSNAFAFDLQGTYQANYKHDKHLWQNRLELAYGLTKTKGDGSRKTSDKIYLNSNYGYLIYKNLYLSALMNFQTQFSKGYDYAVSRDISVSECLSPAYLMAGLGLTWTPDSYFTAVFSPAAWRGTFVRNNRLSDQGAYGVTPGKHLLSEFGANLKLEGNYPLMKNINLYSRLDLFSDYLRKPQNIDVNWEVQLTMMINKWFSASLNTNLVYDDDVRITQTDGRKVKRVQFKELLGVGFQFNF